MKDRIIPASELIINEDGSAFHIHLRPEQVYDNIIFVGDPGRVKLFASLFDKIDYEVSSREFHTIGPKHLGLVIEDWDSVTVEGSGADFIFHGTMLPVAVTGSEGVTLRNFHIDFENPHIAQARVLANGPDGIEFETCRNSSLKVIKG